MSVSWTWDAERHAELVRLAAEGLTAREIGERLGVSRSAVIGRAWRTGVKLARTFTFKAAAHSATRGPSPAPETRRCAA